MIKIEFEVEETIAIALAMSRGWSPMIEDTTQPLEGDNYPMIQNPVGYEDYVSGVVSEFLTGHVLNEGRTRVVNEFQSIFNSVENQVGNGTFDALILAGNIDGIKQLVIQSLTSPS